MTRRSSGARDRPRDPAGWDSIAVFAVACAVFVLHGFNGAIGRDFGVFIYGGEQLTRGVPPYVGIFNSVGPLSDAAPGLAILAGRLVGMEPVLAARLAFLGLSAGCCAALYVLARRAFGSRAAGFLAAGLLASAATFNRLATDGPREKTLMLLCLLLALNWLLGRRWFLAGVATAIATLTWQPVLAVAVAGFLGAAAVLPARRLRALGAFVLGGAVPSGVAVAAFALAGALGTALDGFIVIDAVYTKQPSLLTDPGGTVAFLWAGYSWTLVPLLVGLACLPLLLLTARRAGEERWRALLVLVAAEVGALGWLLVAINGAADLFDVLPFGALGSAGLVVGLAERLPRRAGTALVGAGTAAAVAVAAAYALLTQSQALVGQRVAVDSVMDVLPPGAEVLSVNAPDAMVLAGRTNPTPWQVFNGSEDRFLDAHYPGGLAGYAAWVARTRPALVVVGGRDPERWLQHVLATEYADMGRIGAWRWYASRSLGHLRDSRLGSAVIAGRGELRRLDHGALYGPRGFSQGPVSAVHGRPALAECGRWRPFAPPRTALRRSPPSTTSPSTPRCPTATVAPSGSRGWRPGLLTGRWCSCSTANRPGPTSTAR